MTQRGLQPWGACLRASACHAARLCTRLPAPLLPNHVPHPPACPRACRRRLAARRATAEGHIHTLPGAEGGRAAVLRPALRLMRPAHRSPAPGPRPGGQRLAMLHAWGMRAPDLATHATTRAPRPVTCTCRRRPMRIVPAHPCWLRRTAHAALMAMGGQPRCRQRWARSREQFN